MKHVDIDYGDDGLVFSGFDVDADEYADFGSEEIDDDAFDAISPDIFA